MNVASILFMQYASGTQPRGAAQVKYSFDQILARAAKAAGDATVSLAKQIGLDGLSREEQVLAVFSDLQVSSAEEMCAAADILLEIGAIAQSDYNELVARIKAHATLSLTSESTAEERAAAMLEERDWNEVLEEVFGFNEALYMLLIQAWRTRKEVEAEDEELKAMWRKIDLLQAAIREAIRLRNEKRDERELLDMADAERKRLQAVFGLTDWNEAGMLDLEQLDLFALL